MQVSRGEDGKMVDNGCHKLTASFVRKAHLKDKRTPVCLFYEVCDGPVYDTYCTS